MLVAAVRPGKEIEPARTLPAGETSLMCTAAIPAGQADELDFLEMVMGSLAAVDPAGLPDAKSW